MNAAQTRRQHGNHKADENEANEDEAHHEATDLGAEDGAGEADEPHEAHREELTRERARGADFGGEGAPG